MNYDKLTKTLRQHGVSCVRAHGRYCSICDEAATALSTLQAENEKLRDELEKVKQKYDEAREAICTHCMDVPCRGESCYWWRSQKED